jgi:histone H3/H4
MQNKDSTEQSDAMTKSPPTANLPKAIVKRIVMLDEDQSRVSNGAIEIVSKAAEVFLATLARKSKVEAKGSARNTIHFRDVGAAIRDSLMDQ